MKLTVLGCGDAFGSGARNNTSFLLTSKNKQLNGRPECVLIDCGASTLIRLRQHGISPTEISTIILSHFHGDHYGGLPFVLISSLFEERRTSPLTIVGPKGVRERVFNLQEVMYAGTVEKLSALELNFLEYKPGQDLIVGDKVISCKEAEHSPPSNPHCIRLEWDDKIFAFSGDTSWTDNLIPLSADADLFICECNFLDHDAVGHLSLRELEVKRSQIKCDNIWLTHMGTKVIETKTSLFNKLEDGMEFSF